MLEAAGLVSIWVALVLLVSGEAGKRLTGAAERRARAAWIAGAALCALHMAIAFVVIHGGSHASAVADTARQTAALYGIAWGGGVYVNYLFLIVWMAEACWWQIAPGSYRTRPRWMAWTVRVFFFVVLFNAAVVFARPAGRVVGLVLSAALLNAWRPASPRRAL